ncbi:SDR family NAD(P)-dependent oxidoreductase [Microbacterium sp. ARD31]|uniref:SDR family NAD(P)-dependent oxidoreductase n=1 Tax=Microbacterium sp. ARD31 TaxID=2962576 RepID=UPI002881FC2D|nr:SDR family NAD(P)-dependent oxidoreductase [Microbacterium sp. ARD31]MDT0181991.1 SDR family NAD(P)-dependent oxidoreductase [Microbacterium sp. ARD31]
MDFQLRDTRALITGSTQGIGFAIAEALAFEGAAVLLNGRDAARTQTAAERLRALVPGADVDVAPGDVADPAALTGLPELDILVNNAGAFGLNEFADADDAEWQRYLDVNLTAGVRLSRRVLPGMLERGWGRILFIASESGVNVPADMIPYGVSKAATIALGNGLAKLTRGTQVTVNTVLGGPTYSDGVATVIESIATAQGVPADAVAASVIGRNTTTLLQRFIRPEEIAALVAFLASPRASAINGAALRADGGVLTGML